jgi:hypothetical protein
LRPALAVLAFAALAGSALAAEPVSTIDTPGQGRLIMCRDWLVYTSCWSYHHIAIPTHVKIGDTLDLAFGSNNKEIDFPVARILRDGDRCDLYNTPNGAIRKVNRIKVEGCKPAAE